MGFERFGYTAGLSAVAETPKVPNVECGWTHPSIAAISDITAARVISHTRKPSGTTHDAIQLTLTKESIELRVFLTQTGAEPDQRSCGFPTCCTAS
jgi:hypothetical protein